METSTTSGEARTRELEAGIAEIRRSPGDRGCLDLIVRRPAIGDRDLLVTGELDPVVGLVGDTWSSRPSSRTVDGGPHPDMQLTLMNSRAIRLIAGEAVRWPLAGDQLYVDLDLGIDNLPPGTRLRIGSAEIEVTDQPHTGCAKFTERFGIEALRFVNSDGGKAMRLRGLNARVVRAGTVSVGDVVEKVGTGNGATH